MLPWTVSTHYTIDLFFNFLSVLQVKENMETLEMMEKCSDAKVAPRDEACSVFFNPYFSYVLLCTISHVCTICY